MTYFGLVYTMSRPPMPTKEKFSGDFFPVDTTRLQFSSLEYTLLGVRLTVAHGTQPGSTKSSTARRTRPSDTSEVRLWMYGQVPRLFTHRRKLRSSRSSPSVLASAFIHSSNCASCCDCVIFLSRNMVLIGRRRGVTGMSCAGASAGLVRFTSTVPPPICRPVFLWKSSASSATDRRGGRAHTSLEERKAPHPRLRVSSSTTAACCSRDLPLALAMASVEGATLWRMVASTWGVMDVPSKSCTGSWSASSRWWFTQRISRLSGGSLENVSMPSPSFSSSMASGCTLQDTLDRNTAFVTSQTTCWMASSWALRMCSGVTKATLHPISLAELRNRLRFSVSCCLVRSGPAFKARWSRMPESAFDRRLQRRVPSLSRSAMLSRAMPVPSGLPRMQSMKRGRCSSTSWYSAGAFFLAALWCRPIFGGELLCGAFK
mmetsp:Transcript_3126/g.7625  ORF Transcript_3126/g.7625 Transcript_3126/m.7625 type:complete len:431 (+) Transcript_3126:427-1719(+)